MSIRIKELMETLTQANEAQEAVPAMKAELARLQRALEASQTEATRYKKASEDIGVELAETKSKASDIASQRDEAQFRTLELEEKLATISKALSSTLGLVEPPKASEVKAEVKEELAQAPVKAEAHAEVPQHRPYTQTDYHDDYKPQAWEPQPRDEDRHSASEVASPPNPTSLEEMKDKAWSDVKHHFETDASTPPSSSEAHQSTPEGNSAQPTLAEKPAYLGVRWQDKPSYLSWSQFISQGGEKPYWM